MSAPTIRGDRVCAIACPVDAGRGDGDVDTVLSLMTDDAVFLMPGQPPMSKAGFAIAACARSGANAPRIDGTGDIDEIRIVGDWAFLVSRLTVTVTPSEGSRPHRRAGHALTALT